MVYVSKPVRVRVSLREQMFFTRRLAILLRAGVPILRGLEILSGLGRGSGYRFVVAACLHRVRDGYYLSRGLEDFPKVFSQFVVQVVRAGEVSGRLADNLLYVSQELDKRRQLRRRLLGALAYPGFILLVAMVMLGLLLGFVWPRLLPMLLSLGGELPPLTRGVMGLVDFIRHRGLVLLAALVGFGVLAAVAWQRLGVRDAAGRIVLRVPVVGPLMADYHLSQTLRSLSVLMAAGLGMVEALRMTAASVQSLPYRAALEQIGKEVLGGGQVSLAMSGYPRLFPLEAWQMLAVGEDGGAVNQSLDYLAKIYEDAFDERAKGLAASLEPMLLIFMCLLVGLVAAAILSPVYALTGRLHI